MPNRRVDLYAIDATSDCDTGSQTGVTTPHDVVALLTIDGQDRAALGVQRARADGLHDARRRRLLGLVRDHDAAARLLGRLVDLDEQVVAQRLERTADVLFVDAPWGREWDKERTDLDSLPLLRDVLAAAPGRFKRVLAKVPPSFATAAVPGAAAEAFFGHESGDARRVKFVLLDLVL